VGNVDVHNHSSTYTLGTNNKMGLGDEKLHTLPQVRLSHSLNQPHQDIKSTCQILLVNFFLKW